MQITIKIYTNKCILHFTEMNTEERDLIEKYLCVGKDGYYVVKGIKESPSQMVDSLITKFNKILLKEKNNLSMLQKRAGREIIIKLHDILATL